MLIICFQILLSSIQGQGMLSDRANGGPPSFHSQPANPFKDIVRFFIPSFAEIASVPLSSPICSVQNKWRKETGGQLEQSARSRSQTGNWVSRHFMRMRTTGEAKEDSVERNRQGSERERKLGKPGKQSRTCGLQKPRVGRKKEGTERIQKPRSCEGREHHTCAQDTGTRTVPHGTPRRETGKSQCPGRREQEGRRMWERGKAVNSEIKDGQNEGVHGSTEMVSFFSFLTAWLVGS